jgi:hypothetical protein
VAIIIEPRQHPLLEPVLRNFMFYLAPKGWGLVVYHGVQNKHFVEQVTKGWSHVSLVELDVPEDLNGEGYTRVLTDEAFWEGVPGEHVLVFQTDCFLRDNAIEPWLKYDYVGAPWDVWVDPRLRRKVGNGGFSLRKKSAMLRCLQQHPWRSKDNEDIHVSLACADTLDIPSWKEAVAFVVETTFDENVKPLGFHHAWAYIEQDKDLSKNKLYQSVRNYNTEPFLDGLAAREGGGAPSRALRVDTRGRWRRRG